ncbi:hypothetical protein I2F27_11520 [Acinetobacter sp. B5B]|uniref:hypothetical protein n=1 Tax=Acinetobacter baretiae TaxID=2605383 RepID=UPI0018C2F030|nr:hypothetical protein [Acinetobacter baretiae]MBF7683947.1 hypothetical protein [Acinetobacter baretiae]
MQNSEAQAFWERIDVLIGNERPYAWAESKGINKSSFQSARNRGTKPLPKTIKNWANLIDCSYEWLTTGIEEPFDNVKNQEKINIKEELESILEEKHAIPEMNTELLIEAFQTLDNALEQTKKVMPPAGRSRFITAVYDSLRTNDGIDLELLKDSIYTLEEALKLKRQFMSPRSKTRLILAIYELYSGDALYKEAIQHTINQLIGSAYDGNK